MTSRDIALLILFAALYKDYQRSIYKTHRRSMEERVRRLTLEEIERGMR